MSTTRPARRHQLLLLVLAAAASVAALATTDGHVHVPGTMAHAHAEHPHGPVPADVRAAGPVGAAVDLGAGAADDVAGLVEAATCAGSRLLPVEGVELCTHGEDEHPRAARGSDAPGAPVPTRAPACIGDGRSGQRVEVLYVHRRGTAPADAGMVRDVRRWVAQVEWTVGRSAERLDGRRQVRWLVNGSCKPQVRSVEVSADALQDFSAQISELRAQGLDRNDRTYVLFTASDRYCGIGTAPRDDRPSGNRADTTAGYARVDRPCWDVGDRGFHSIAAHELLHTLGSVQASAPNATPGAHCTDEHDLLCYDDGTGGSTRVVCRDDDGRTAGAGDAHDRLLDCNGDDYFNPAPRPGSYLATHWNSADSARLHDPATVSSAADDGGSGGQGRFTIGITRAYGQRSG